MAIVVKKSKVRIYQVIAKEFELWLERQRELGNEPSPTLKYIRFNQISDTYLNKKKVNSGR
jgi:hypothetical protein